MYDPTSESEKEHILQTQEAENAPQTSVFVEYICDQFDFDQIADTSEIRSANFSAYSLKSAKQHRDLRVQQRRRGQRAAGGGFQLRDHGLLGPGGRAARSDKRAPLAGHGLALQGQVR